MSDVKRSVLVVCRYCNHKQRRTAFQGREPGREIGGGRVVRSGQAGKRSLRIDKALGQSPGKAALRR